jgi:hypothetical protein
VLNSDITAERQAAITKAVAAWPNQMLVRADQSLHMAVSASARPGRQPARVKHGSQDRGGQARHHAKGLVVKRQRLGLEQTRRRLSPLLTAGAGRLPVRRYAPRLRPIMDDQGERTPERLTSDVQFHRNIRWHSHGSSDASPGGAARRPRHCSPASTYQASGPGCVCTLELSPGRMTA